MVVGVVVPVNVFMTVQVVVLLGSRVPEHPEEKLGEKSVAGLSATVNALFPGKVSIVPEALPENVVVELPDTTCSVKADGVVVLPCTFFITINFAVVGGGIILHLAARLLL